MRKNTLDAQGLSPVMARVVLLGPHVDVSDDFATAALTAARLRAAYSTLVAKGRLTVQYDYRTDDFRVTMDANGSA